MTAYWRQLEDWDDKEHIPDPEDKKPEVNIVNLFYSQLYEFCSQTKFVFN